MRKQDHRAPRRLSKPIVAIRRALRRDHGQALVELAVVMPLFTILIVGSAEFARLAYAAIEVANAAQAGVHYGAQSHATAASTSDMQSAATNDGSNVASLTATATTFCVCSNGTSITCANAGTTCTARVIEYVQVNASATVDPLFHLPGLPKTYALQSVAVMRVRQ